MVHSDLQFGHSPSVTPEDLLRTKTRTDDLVAGSEGDWTSGSSHGVALFHREQSPFANGGKAFPVIHPRSRPP